MHLRTVGGAKLIHLTFFSAVDNRNTRDLPEKHNHEHMYGGQAVIEGVMMRGPKYFAVACRRANKDIVVATEPIASVLARLKRLNMPILRGALMIVDALLLGIKALSFSANIAMSDLQEEEKSKKKADCGGENCELAENPSKSKPSRVSDISISLTMIFGLALGVMLFIVTPNLIAGLAKPHVPNKIILNLIEGFIRIGFFVGYVASVSLLKDIRRVFEYHGAEHKIINTYEDKAELVKEEADKRTTVHVRCGTSFILVVLVVSILVFSLLPWRSGLERAVSRIILFPLVAGISYEIIRFAGKRRDSAVLRALLAPGLWLQKITTREPDPEQIEVARIALESVLEAEKREKAGETVTATQITIPASQ